MATLNVRTASDLAYLIPPKWLRKVRQDAIQAEKFSKFSGPEDSRSMIITNNDFTKEPGDTLSISVESELYGAGVSGESTLEGNEEKATLNQFTIQVELYRHAEALTKKANEIAMVKELVKAGGRLSRWIAVKRDDLMFDKLINDSATTVYAGAATTQATLSTSTRFSLDFIDKCKLALVRKGAMPMELEDSKTGEKLPMYCAILDEVSAFRLFSSTDWRNAVQAMLPRSFDHPLIKGALGMWNGVLLTQYNTINQGCHQGTPVRPECSTAGYGSGEYDNSTDAINITVGADNDKQYTKNFPASGYAMINEAGTQSTFRYASLEANAFVLHSDNATINDISGHSGAIADSVNITAQGNMSQIIFSGAEAAGRCWAERDEVITQVRDYGMERGVGLEMYLGQEPIEDSSGNYPNYLIGRCWADVPSYQV